jgi:hypothetical protein
VEAGAESEAAVERMFNIKHVFNGKATAGLV